MRELSPFNVRFSTLSAMALAVCLALIECCAGAQTDLNYSDYGKFIADRNIFNPNRYAHNANNYRPRATRIVHRESFTLAGVMSYHEGETPGVYAFFDGTSSDYRKTLQRDDSIAGFKIASIRSDSITLTQDTNEYVLKVGMGMREESPGHWTVMTEVPTLARNTYSDESRRGSGNRGRTGEVNSRDSGQETSGPDANAGEFAGPGNPGDMPPPDEMGGPPGEFGEPPPEADSNENVSIPSGPGSDALQRLMQQRQQEEQRLGGNRP